MRNCSLFCLICCSIILAGCQSAPLETGLASVDGPAGKITIYSEGSGGTPVVFVHSLAGRWQQWQSQIDHLRKNRRVLAWDMRGHGTSFRDTTVSFSIEEAAQDLHAVVEHYNLGKIILVGHSFGGAVCAGYVAAHPDKVAAIIFVDSAGDMRQAPEENMEHFITMLDSDRYEAVMQAYWEQIQPNSKDEIKAKVNAAMRLTQKKAVLGALRSMQKFDIIGAVAKLDGPMIAVDSEYPEAPFSLHNVIDGLERKIISGTGHWLHMDKPDEFNAIIDAFLLKHKL